MNEKAIAEVRNELRRGWLIEGLDPAFLPRLLDEREVLLTSLRATADALDWASEGRFHQDTLRDARAAIAKAEAE